MRGVDRLAILRGLVDLRRLQVHAAEAQALRAATERADAASRAEDASAMLATDHAQWRTLADHGRFDPDAAARWARAIRDGIELGERNAAALDVASAREAVDRDAWHRAQARVEKAEEQFDDTARTERRRKDEAALHRASEHHMALRGGRG